VVKNTPVPTHGHWVAEKIVDSQPKIDSVTGKSRMEYLIKWEGFGDEWNSWLNEEDVWCKELIDEYNSCSMEIPLSAKVIRKRRGSDRFMVPGMHNVEDEDSDDEWGDRKASEFTGNGVTGGKGNLFRHQDYSTGPEEDDADLYGSLWDLDLDEDLWRDTWDTAGTGMMSDDDEEEEYEEVPVTKEEKEQQQNEFLKALEANANYKPVILFFEKS